MKAYIAHAMTGRTGLDLWAESVYTRDKLGFFGIQTLDPVEAEGVPLNNDVVGGGSIEDLRAHWKRDKRMIREANVLIDITPQMKSEGVAHEIGYARYHLWMPVIRVAGKHPTASSVAFFENDLIVSDLHEAGTKILAMFGTRGKRLAWRIKIYSRYWSRGFWYKLARWWK